MASKHLIIPEETEISILHKKWSKYTHNSHKPKLYSYNSLAFSHFFPVFEDFRYITMLKTGYTNKWVIFFKNIWIMNRIVLHNY